MTNMIRAVRISFVHSLSLVVLATIFLSGSIAQSLEPFAQMVGSAFCMYLAYKSILPRKYFNLCGPPTCGWDDWQDALSAASNGSFPNQRIVVSYSHNGFGNQLWEHSVAFMVAESLKARLLIAIIPDSLSPGGFIPPNTWSGMSAMERLLPPEFLYESLPVNSSIRTLCDNEPFFASDRPYDWRSKNYSQNFRPQLHDILSDSKPRCLKLLGYFQNLPLCQEDARRLWMNRMIANFTTRPGENDISIYLRCIPRHYHFNDVHWYESILNHTTFDRIWLFQAPECPNKLSDNPAKDNLVTSVVRLLRERFNATRWPAYEGPDDTTALLHDLAGLAMSKKLILPLSSWAFWAGMLSNATEIHVNAPPLHPLMPHNEQYIYHDEKHRMYFGRYNATANDIEYDIKPGEELSETMASRIRSRGQGSHQSNNSSTREHPHHSGSHHRGGNVGKHGAHGHGHAKNHGKNSHNNNDQSTTGSIAHNITTSPVVPASVVSSTQLPTATNLIIGNVGVNVTIQVEIMKNTYTVDTYSLFQSSYTDGINLSGNNFALNRTVINDKTFFLVQAGSIPVFSMAATFDVKASISVALCDHSILRESYSFTANSNDLRDSQLQNLGNAESVMTPTVNKESVTTVMKSLLTASAISLPLT